MLKVGDGVDAVREWNLPGLFGEPRCGFKGESRCGVSVLRHDGKKDVVALAVRVLHSLVCEELRVVFGKVDVMVGRKLKQQRAACCNSGQDNGSDDDRPSQHDGPATAWAPVTPRRPSIAEFATWARSLGCASTTSRRMLKLMTPPLKVMSRTSGGIPTFSPCAFVHSTSASGTRHASF